MGSCGAGSGLPGVGRRCRCAVRGAVAGVGQVCPPEVGNVVATDARSGLTRSTIDAVGRPRPRDASARTLAQATAARRAANRPGCGRPTLARDQPGGRARPRPSEPPGATAARGRGVRAGTADDRGDPPRRRGRAGLVGGGPVTGRDDRLELQPQDRPLDHLIRHHLSRHHLSRHHLSRHHLVRHEHVVIRHEHVGLEEVRLDHVARRRRDACGGGRRGGRRRGGHGGHRPLG